MKTVRLSIFVVLAALLLLAPGCDHRAQSKSTVPTNSPTDTAIGTAPKVEDVFPGDDIRGLIAGADRLCTYIGSEEQRAFGLAAASRAFTALSKSSAGTVGERAAASPADPALLRSAALVLSRCTWLAADFEPDKVALLTLTETGIDAAVAAGAKDGDPEAAYFLALNLGLNIRNRGAGALALVKDLEAALQIALKKPETDLGGPLRVLGYLYLKAPSRPVGPGDLDAALEALKDASKRFPTHPLNHIFYAEALMADDNNEEALKELKVAAAEALPLLWGDYAGRFQSDINALSAETR